MRRIIVNDTNELKTNSQCLFDLVKQRFGKRLSPDELAEVEKSVKGILKAVAALRSVNLENGDEPCTLFIPYRKEV